MPKYVIYKGQVITYEQYKLEQSFGVWCPDSFSRSSVKRAYSHLQQPLRGLGDKYSLEETNVVRQVSCR